MMHRLWNTADQAALGTRVIPDHEAAFADVNAELEPLVESFVLAERPPRAEALAGASSFGHTTVYEPTASASTIRRPVAVGARLAEAGRVRVSCESCGAAVPAEDVNLERMVAKCRSCQAVFEVRAPSKAPAERPIVSAGRVPDGVEVSEGAADPSAYREAGAAPPKGAEAKPTAVRGRV